MLGGLHARFRGVWSCACCESQAATLEARGALPYINIDMEVDIDIHIDEDVDIQVDKDVDLDVEYR